MIGILASGTHPKGWFYGLAIEVGKKLGAFLKIGDIGPEFVEPILYVIFVLPLVLVACVLSTRNLKTVPSGVQNFFESIVALLDRFAKNLIGPRGYYFVPIIGTFFIYIYSMNLFGHIPGMKSPTANINITVSLAAVAFLTTHFAGVRFMKAGYLKHFLGEPLWLAPLMFPIHVVGELVRPVSLSVRLFGNIMGEETVVAIFMGMGIATGLFIPFHVPVAALGLFTGFVQALIFSLLTSIYIAGAVHEEH